MTCRPSCAPCATAYRGNLCNERATAVRAPGRLPVRAAIARRMRHVARGLLALLSVLRAGALAGAAAGGALIMRDGLHDHAHVADLIIAGMLAFVVLALAFGWI